MRCVTLQEYEEELEKLKLQKKEYDLKMEEIRKLQVEKKVRISGKTEANIKSLAELHTHAQQAALRRNSGVCVCVCLLQEYEAKLEELEAALAHQLKTDTAVEKLEEQRQVLVYKSSVAGGWGGGAGVRGEGLE